MPAPIAVVWPGGVAAQLGVAARAVDMVSSVSSMRADCETYEELRRHAGLGHRDVVRTLQALARDSV